MTALAARIREFAALLTRCRGENPDTWIKTVREDDLPAVHAFVADIEKDHDAVVAGLTPPHGNGPMEGANTKSKMIKRQRYGRAGMVGEAAEVPRHHRSAVPAPPGRRDVEPARPAPTIGMKAERPTPERSQQMRIRARMSMSADGYVTTPDGWPALTADPSFVSGKSHGIQEFLEGCEAALMGRTTFEPALITTGGRGRT